MTCNTCKPEDCIAPKGWLCKDSGNFYSTGEYSRTIEFFNIHGVSFNQKVDSVKILLDYNTLQILKVLLQEVDAPAELDYPTSLNVVATLELIQSRLSNDNQETERISVNNSYHSGSDKND